MPPLVSVVIPAHGQAEYLLQALESVHHQTFTDFEVIVVDDGSQPSLEAALAPVRDRIRYVYQESKGPGGARNRGVELARGQFVAFLDSDDLWDSTKLEKQVACMREKTDCGLCVTNEVLIDGSGRTTKRNTRSLKAGLMQERIFSHIMVNMSSAMIRRDVFERGFTFWSERRYCEDWNLWMRMAFEVKVAIVDEPLTSYRKVDAGRATNSGDRMFQDGLYAIDDAIEHLRQTGIAEARLRRCRRLALHVIRYHYFSFLIGQSRLPEAMRHYAAIARRPWTVQFVKASAKLGRHGWSRRSKPRGADP